MRIFLHNAWFYSCLIRHLIFCSFLCESKIFKRAVEIDIWVLKLTMAFKRRTTIQFCPRCSIWVKCAVPPYIVSNTFEAKIKIDYWFLKLKLRLIKLRLIIVISLFFFLKTCIWLLDFAVLQNRQRNVQRHEYFLINSCSKRKRWNMKS